jgi:polar amino acid transport system substrate-binding protein
MAFAPVLQAACTRPIVVPASPLGSLIVVNDSTGAVFGIYPDVLREYGSKYGCEFLFPIVPRARAEFMVRNGLADLLVGSVQVTERDTWGVFVPMLGTDWVLISSRTDEAPKTIDQLVGKPDIRFNAVKSFNDGPAYMAMLGRLEQAHKLEYVNDTQTIVRKMLAGRADYTVMPSTIFAGTLAEMGLKETRGKDFHYTRLEGIPGSVAGAYISKATPRDDARAIASVLTQIRNDGQLLVHLRSLFSADEMTSNYALPIATETQNKSQH